MGIFKIFYSPNISLEGKGIIKKEVSSSMTSSDEESHQYEISMCLKALQVNLDTVINTEDVVSDIQTLKRYIQDGISFIEF